MPAIEALSKRHLADRRRAVGASELTEPSSSWRKVLTFFKQLNAEARSTSKFLQVERQYQELGSSLEKYATLDDNWDSYGAEKPSLHSVAATETFLRKLRAELFMPNRIVPSAEGGIAVYFNNGTKVAYVEFRNSSEVILAMYDSEIDPLIIELTENDGDQSRALSLIRAYISA